MYISNPPSMYIARRCSPVKLSIPPKANCACKSVRDLISKISIKPIRVSFSFSEIGHPYIFI